MNTKFKIFLCITLLIISSGISAQNIAGILPSINYHKTLFKDNDLNFKYESRHLLFNNQNEQKTQYKYLLSDISTLFGHKMTLNSKFTFGGLVRFELQDIYFRTIQQYIFKSKIINFRVAHRIAADQTFANHTSPTFRLRYRISSEIPFAGLKADIKEFYFKLNMEVLNSIENNIYDLELRIVPNIGYTINKRNKIELGLDFRMASFIQDQWKASNWLSINWYF